MLGAALATGLTLFVRNKRAAVNVEQPSTTVLSDSTRAALSNLTAPVEIRFYALLDPASVSEADQAFASRVDQLLAEYEREGDGRIVVVRHLSSSDVVAATAAAADGVTSFNIEKGDACFFGIAIVQNNRKETLPRLSAEWEQALEADISRAIKRVAAGNVSSGPAFSTSGVEEEAKATESLKQALPHLADVSLEEGRKQLREAALTEFKAATEEFEKQIRDAQQRIAEAQSSKSETAQQDAIKALREVQAAQSEKIKAIAARAQAQVEAFEKLKRAQAAQ
jgi:hypothetical protein